MQRILIAVFTLVIFTSQAKAQKQLPDFSAEDLGKNKIRISWVNPFNEGCIQLNVQFSFDSIKNFRTIFSTESPQLPQNGFVYTTPYTGKFYYRISYILDGNAFYFSKAKIAVPVVYVPSPENINNTSANTIVKDIIDNPPIPPKPEVLRFITVRNKDSVFARLLYPEYRKFKDSILRRTRDTLLITGQDDVLIKQFDPASIYIPSKYVVTNPDGFIEVKLPEAATKKYKLIFFDIDGKKLFSLNRITETELVIDKTNFMHAGWFKFELYEDEKLKERNKILLQKDLK